MTRFGATVLLFLAAAQAFVVTVPATIHRGLATAAATSRDTSPADDEDGPVARGGGAIQSQRQLRWPFSGGGGLARSRAPSIFDFFNPEDFFGSEDGFGSLLPSVGGSRWAASAPVAHLDISEMDKEWRVSVDLPGVKKSDITVRVEDGVLRISAQRRQEAEEKDETFHRVERSFGLVQRSVVVPENADPDDVRAEFREGVLKVTIGKTEAPKPKGKAIEIQ